MGAATNVRAADRATLLRLDAVVLRPMAEAEVPARQTGVLAKIAVDEGAVVQAGDVVAMLDDRTARLAVEKATLERDQASEKAASDVKVEYADKALEVARAELARSQESIERFTKSISQSQLDVERLTVEKLELERKAAEEEMTLAGFELRVKQATLDAAQLELDLHAVKAPFAGVVALVRGRTGEWVEPGTAVVRLVGVNSLRAEGFAPTDALGALRVGAHVVFARNKADDSPSYAAPAKNAPDKFAGVLRFVSPEVDPVNRQVRVWAEIDNAAQALHPGEQGTLEIAPAP